MVKLFDIIYEANRYTKETGESIPRWRDLFKKYENSKEYFVHFSNVPRVGLYLINKYDTPIGFYSYPLYFQKMSNFAIDRPYAIVFKIKPEARLLDLYKYEIGHFYNDKEILKKKYGITDEQISKWSIETRRQGFAGYLWNITRNVSLLHGKKENFKKGETGGGSTAKWTNILNKDLGYDGVVDDGFGIIHHSEPYQTVLFNTNTIEVIDIINIPKGKVSRKDDFKKNTNNFYGKDLRGKDFKDQDLDDAVFTNANLENANFHFSDLRRAKLRGANLIGANLENTGLLNADLTDANLSWAKLERAILRRADLTNANMKYADLTNANMKYADLTNANITGANLSGCDLENVVFKNTIYDKHTKFPEHFHPKMFSGLILDW